TPSLERLSEMVRQAEVKSRAQKLGVEGRQAADGLRAAEERARVTEKRLHDERPIHQKAREEADNDDQKLKDLMRKIAQMLSSGDITREEARTYTAECEASQIEIDIK